MNRMETQVLFAQGLQVWNDWADQMLLQRRALEDAGEWTDGLQLERNEATQQWHEKAKADFSGHDFESEVSFVDFRFPGAASFEGTTFDEEASFDRAQFHDDAKFTGAVLLKGATFLGVEFMGDALFSGAKFAERTFFPDSRFHGAIRFDRARFEGEIDFHSNEFHGDVSFNRAEFVGRTTFYQAIFLGVAHFQNITISDITLFNEVRFCAEAYFDRTVLETPLHLLQTKFESDASFTTISGASLILHRLEFEELPDFSGAHLEEPPQFDTLNLDAARLNQREVTTPIGSLSARWRALRRLAEQGHDHERELQFFKGEVIARRGTEDKRTHLRYWVGWLYELFSDFGRSMAQPLVWLVVSVWIFAGIYASQSPRLLTPADPQPPLCVSGSGNATIAALTLSVHNAAPFAGVGSSETVDQIYACLYGTAMSQMPTQGTFPATGTPGVPYAVALVGVAQFFVSAILIFLMVLAIRNWFRIK